MSSVDERVVQMRFDNAAFQRGVEQTLRSLETLNKGLQLQGAAQGLTDVSTAAKNQAASLKNVETGVQSIADRFKMMSVVATTALATVTHQAVSAAGRLVKSFTLEPILEGFREYEINMNSIQTIMANTGLEGKKGLATVTAALDELNHYADQTIYNFSEMAKNIGTFTAAGVELDTATAAIKGIANLAAVSGSNAEQAAGAMYQLSQGIAAGVLTLEDWNSVVNAGMGGKVFQDALMETARVHGVAIDQMVKDEGSFRLTLQNGWLTGEIMTETLSKFTGDLTAEQLKTMGYNQKQIAGILKMGKTAQDAATKVKTITQLMSTLNEGLTSGWARTWQTIFGDFYEARTLFTNVSNVLGGIIEKSSNARNEMLSDWKKLGGRTVIIEAISNAFDGLVSVLKPIGQAFRDIFPATTGKQLYDLTVRLRDFTERLKVGSENADRLKRTFAGVFAVFGIAFDIVRGVVGVIFDLVGVVAEGSGGFLEITATIGDFLVAIRKGTQQGELFKNIFDGLSTVLGVPIKLIQKLAGFLASLFEDTDSSNVAKGIGEVGEKLEPLGRLGEVASMAWGKVLTVMENVQTFFQGLGSKMTDFFSGVGFDVASMFDDLGFDNITAGINTGLFAGIVLMLRNLIGGGGLGGIMESVTDAMDNLTGALGAMQNTLRAATLLQIALAVGILAVSMNTLSEIDAAGLARGSAAISVMFGQLLGSLLIFEKLSGFAGYAKMPVIAASLILMGLAIRVLVSSVKELSELSWEELAKGLYGTSALLAAITGAATLMPNPKGLISTGIGLVILAGAIKILVSAVTDLSGLSWEDLSKGLLGVGALLGGLFLFTQFAKVGKSGLIQGAGIILLATGIKILASAVRDFSSMSWEDLSRGMIGMAGGLVLVAGALKLIPPSAIFSAVGVLLVAASLGMISDAMQSMGSMSWDEIGRGLAVMAGALLLIGAALYLIPPTALLSAAGVLVVAASLGMISDALQDMATMSWDEIGRGLTLLAGALGIIAGALILMSGTLTGAAALLVVSGALLILQPVLQAFGEMSWEEIGKGLLTLAGALTVIGVAGYLLAPVVPAILALGAAIALIGFGMLTAGAGALLFATALTALAAAGGAATAMIIGIVAGLISLIPLVMMEIGNGIVAFAKVIAMSGSAITDAIVVLLESLIDAIVILTPKIINAFYKLLLKLVQAMGKYIPKMVDAGLKLLIGVLTGISDNIEMVVVAATILAIKFLKTLGDNIPKFIQAGVTFILKLVAGVTKAIDQNAEALGRAGGRLAVAIVRGMAKGISAGVSEIASAAKRVAESALESAKSALGIASPSKEFEKIGKFVNDGFRKGLDGNKDQIYKAFDDLKKMLSDLAKNAKASSSERRRASAAHSELTKKLNDERSELGKLANTYDSYTERIKKANETLDSAIKTRDDYNKQIRDQYSDMPSATGETQLADYLDDLRKQVENTKVFSNAVQRLRALGLNDETYKDLLGAGVSALPFVEELLAGGRTGVDEINRLGKELDIAGSALGKSASQNLYQAAVDSAAGLVKGLESQQKNIEKQMDKIADAMVRSIKKKLGIKSPSRVLMEVGGYSAEGLAKGMGDMSGLVEKSAAKTGQSAVDALRESLSGVSDVLGQDLDIQPTITPVLDLSNVKKDAGLVSGLLATHPLLPESAYSKARHVASSRVGGRFDTYQREGATQPGGITYIQNNNSPKALSSAEIYRQTKNQLSKTKGALVT